MIMPRIRCTPKVQFVVWLNVALIFFAGAVILYMIGAIMFEEEHSAKAIHVENICEVISSYSDESYCSGGRGSSYVCYKPVWMVAYSIQEGGDEIRIDARIQHGGFRKAENAQNKLDEYQVGNFYSCWCNVIYPSEARWNEPNTLDGLLMLIFGGVSTILCFVSIFFTCRARRKF